MKLLTSPVIFFICICLPNVVVALPLEPTAAPSDAKVYFIHPQNGAKVQAPFTVKFGLVNMGIAPEGIDVEGTGHHHLSIDGRLSLNPNEPMGNEVIHLDNGQTQIELFLTPGRHSLQIILGDFLHRPFDPPVVSEVITVTVSTN
jgi:hypothetical protein